MPERHQALMSNSDSSKNISTTKSVTNFAALPPTNRQPKVMGRLPVKTNVNNSSNEDLMKQLAREPRPIRKRSTTARYGRPPVSFQ